MSDEPTPTDEARPNDEVYNILTERAEKMIDEADTLVREANTLHRFCEMMRPGSFYPIEIATLYDKPSRTKWPSS